jgi:protein SCO1/2
MNNSASKSVVAGWVRFLIFALVIWSAGCGKKEDEAFEVLRSPEPVERLKRHWVLPEFELTERTGKGVRLADFLGKVWVTDFFYTSCPGPCPMLTSRLSELHKATAGMNGVLLASITAQPEKDTPEVLAKYASRFGADERWLFLTGSKPAIYELANSGFKLGLSEQGGTVEEPVTHSSKLCLVDKNGMVRGFYEGLTPESTRQILEDIRVLLKESR